MFASSSTCAPSALTAGLLAVQDQPILEQDELALHLAESGRGFGVGSNHHQSVAAIDDDQVAGSDGRR